MQSGVDRDEVVFEASRLVTRGAAFCALRRFARPVALAVSYFLLPFVRWYGIPSPLAAALLAGGGGGTCFELLGLAASITLRALWGAQTDVWQYIGCLCLWIAKRRFRTHRAMEDAALAGLAMLPRAVAAVITGSGAELLLCCAAIPLAMLLAMLFRGGFEAFVRTSVPNARQRAGAALFCFAVVSGLGYFQILGLNLGHVGAAFCTVGAACAGGLSVGGLGGLGFGLALGLGGHDIRAALSLSMIGLCCGQACVRNRRFLCVPASLLGCLFGFTLSPLAAPPPSVWAVLTGSVLFSLLSGSVIERLTPYMEKPHGKPSTLAFIRQRIGRLREALTNVSDTLQPDGVPEPARVRLERELMLTHLAAMNDTLDELNTLSVGESLLEESAYKRISSAIEALSIPVVLRGVRRVKGHFHVILEDKGVLASRQPLSKLLRWLAAKENLRLEITRSVSGRLELEETPLYTAEVGVSFLCAGEPDQAEVDSLCGDTCSVCRLEGGHLLVMLSDGMGHGAGAHRQSQKTLELLTRLINAGYSRRQALTAANGMMLTLKEDESFATVDLADIDLWTGEVSFEKLGACASWVVRGERVLCVEASSLPLGVMEEAQPTSGDYWLHHGDRMIMLSDGIADLFPESVQMERFLLDNCYIESQRMADAVLRGALLYGGGAPRDDMSCVVVAFQNGEGVSLDDTQSAKGYAV